MLEQCRGLPIPWVVALKSLDEGDGHGSVEKRIFAIDLFAPAPARVAGEIGLRSPQHQNLTVVLFGLRDKPRFVAFHTTGLPNQIGVPRFTHSRRLRKLRCGNGRAVASAATALNYSVNSFGAS